MAPEVFNLRSELELWNSLRVGDFVEYCVHPDDAPLVGEIVGSKPGDSFECAVRSFDKSLGFVERLGITAAHVRKKIADGSGKRKR